MKFWPGGPISRVLQGSTTVDTKLNDNPLKTNVLPENGKKSIVIIYKNRSVPFQIQCFSFESKKNETTF